MIDVLMDKCIKTVCSKKSKEDITLLQYISSYCRFISLFMLSEQLNMKGKIEFGDKER